MPAAPKKRFKLRTLLLAGSVFLVVCLVAIAVIVTLASAQASKVAAQAVQAETIMGIAFEQNSFARDYIAHGESRPKEQWYLEYAALETALASPVLQSEPSKSFVPRLESSSDGLKEIFDSIVAGSESGADDQAKREQKISDLLVKARAFISDADKMTRAAFDARAKNRASTDRLIFIMVGLLAAVSLSIVFVLYRRIAGSLGALQKGARIIGKGNLEYRMNYAYDCEFGELAAAFDEMAFRLEKGRDTLEEKVQERTQQLAELNRKNETMLQSIGDGVVAIDRHWDIILWNAAAAHITGWSAGEAMGKPLREVIKFIRAEDHRESIEFIERVMLFGETTSMDQDTLLVGKDGGTVPVGDSAAPIYDPKTGKVSGAIIVFRDASSEKALKERERQLAKLKDDFLFRTVHDLRSPAANIRMALDVHAEEEVRYGASPRLKAGFDSIRDASARMSRLIEDLLQIARGEKSDVVLKKETIDLAKLVERVLTQSQPTASAAGVTVSQSVPDEMPHVIGDTDALKEIFDNLVNNAIKYNKKGGSVTVLYEAAGDFLKATVQDTGIGISSEDLKKLFTPYFRAEGSAVQGTGLGLYIVKNLAEKMGGTVHVHSVVGQGSQFMVTVPIVKK